jgi:hypothetical protein
LRATEAKRGRQRPKGVLVPWVCLTRRHFSAWSCIPLRSLRLAHLGAKGYSALSRVPTLWPTGGRPGLVGGVLPASGGLPLGTLVKEGLSELGLLSSAEAVGVEGSLALTGGDDPFALVVEGAADPAFAGKLGDKGLRGLSGPPEGQLAAVWSSSGYEADPAHRRESRLKTIHQVNSLSTAKSTPKWGIAIGPLSVVQYICRLKTGIGVTNPSGETPLASTGAGGSLVLGLGGAAGLCLPAPRVGVGFPS